MDISKGERVYAGMVVTAATALIAKMTPEDDPHSVYYSVFVMCVRRKPNPDLSRFPFG
jgi:hypothetical protein